MKVQRNENDVIGFYLIYACYCNLFKKILACMQIAELIKSATIFVYDEGLGVFAQIV